jgi:hypothetical protein
MQTMAHPIPTMLSVIFNQDMVVKSSSHSDVEVEARNISLCILIFAANTTLQVQYS